jgi:D-alanyl-D-alanine carboxypeptidase/D-alanyl-D-alanine-endopeptidase (penicillin-binding protein 4)
VRSLDRGETLFELNPQALLVPASIAKIVSAASAADAVGWDFRFATTLRARGAIANGVLDGDLIVTGSGDPSLGGRAGATLAPFVEAVRRRGVRRITGRVIGNDNAIEEPRPALAWAWDDLGYTTGALFGALNLDENRMRVVVAPGGAEGAPAALRVDPRAAARPLVNRVVTGAPRSPQLLWPEQRPGEPSLTIAGSIPAGAAPASVSVSVGNPTLWFASVLRHELLRAGIDVVGDAWDIDEAEPAPSGDAGGIVHVLESARLSDLVQPMLKDSINLYGEAVLRLNAAPGAFPTNDAALDGLRARLAGWGIDLSGQQIIDGSGLSRRDVLAADTMMQLLQRVHDPSGGSPLVRGLPIAGVDGSLANRMRGTPAAGNVRAKTGTMSNIRSLAGYVTTRDGEQLAFVVMLNNFEGTGTIATQAVDAIAVRLAAFSRAGAP